MDIYAASEKPIEGVTAEALVERIRQFGHRGAEYVGTIDRGVEALWPRGAGGRPGPHAGRGQRLAGRRQDSGAAAGGRADMGALILTQRRGDGAESEMFCRDLRICAAAETQR